MASSYLPSRASSKPVLASARAPPSAAARAHATNTNKITTDFMGGILEAAFPSILPRPPRFCFSSSPPWRGRRRADGRARELALHSGVAGTLEWRGRIASLDTAWAAVVVPDDDLTLRKEVLGAAWEH